MVRFFILAIIVVLGMLLVINTASALTEFSYGTCFESSHYDGITFTCVKSWDNGVNTYWSVLPTSFPGYNGMDYGVGISHIITRYTIQHSNDVGYYATAWQLRGSNDNSSFTSLDSQTGQSFTPSEKKTFDFSNIVAYRYYQVYVTAGDLTFSVIAEVELLGDDTPPPDTTPPDSITGLSGTVLNCSSIQWDWTNPTTSDFNHTYVLNNNAFMANYTNTTTTATWVTLTENTVYTVSSKTVDLSGNMNLTWVNRSETTDVCPTPTPTPTPTPLAIPVFGDVYGFLSACNGITWILSIPIDAAYNGTMVYQNNTHLYNVTNLSASVFWVGLDQGIDYTISTKAIYLNGSINNTWKNGSSHTALCDCLLCGLITTAPPGVPGMPYYPAAPAGNWIKEMVMQNAWWLILLIGAILILRRT